ncbi:von Willebrand factor A domain-containing protein DDB_G0292740 isoform X1 [Ricinus communis]|uniref:von Willebrand factor A domain-containing protein DDB_G0292740 isoform X1 n=2 Tax=Ricinus communis TaxID=3988 RepID=UPI00201A5B35|nr:von Willebrand factor A domain-containing protein DDB_G0292740 isoform X1 [Ricinus communis]
MAEEFGNSVEDGLKLSKRLYYGKDRAVAPPRPVVHMEKSAEAYLPTAPMIYAVISDPSIVDNPDMPSYQPHVHGRCDPPALIPLQMNRIELEADSFLDSAIVRVNGSWRVHCVMGSKSCDCRIAIPMGEQGSILGVEVEVARKSYYTELIAMDDKKDTEKECRPENGGFLTPQIFTLTIPKVDGGSSISIKVSWIQKLLYHDGELSLTVPFSFPEFVTPAVKKLPKKEKILLNVNSGTGTEVVCKTTSHPLKQLKREAGKLGFSYESEVLTWTDIDFAVSYSVSSSHIFGGVMLQSPSAHDVDQRDMFYLYLFPGDQPNMKVFRKEIVFIVDISGSMEGKPLEGMKNAMSGALAKLNPKDSFNIIAFNGETYLFSSLMELATEKTVERAVEWMNLNFIAGGGTNISVPLNQAMEMVSNTQGSLPVIFLVTDGAVEDERHICDSMKKYVRGKGAICPRIYTFGIGTYCNHYFLRMLATVCRGQYDAAYDVDSVQARMENFFSRGLSAVLANVMIDTLDDLDDVEVYPSNIPDLSSESLLIISGRYHGNFPGIVKAEGVLGNLSNFVVDLKIQKTKDVPFDKIFAKQQIDLLTAQAWYSENKQLEEKVAKMSIQTGVASEYTRLTLLEMERGNQAIESPRAHKFSNKTDSLKVDYKGRRRILLQNFGVGFGNLAATADNIPPGVEELKLPEAAELIMKAASNCCGRVCGQCCCMCCIQCCSRMNDQCAIALTQLFAALACFGCVECCSLCCSGGDGH